MSFLRVSIQNHRYFFREAFPASRFKPKHHYIEHYPELIREYGPLINFHTMRFEAKHSFFKRIIHQLNNYKDLLFSLAYRHQMFQAYYINSNCYPEPHFQSSKFNIVSSDFFNDESRAILFKLFGSKRLFSRTSIIEIYGITYRVGMFLVHNFFCLHPSFCRIDHILQVNKQIYFVCMHHSSYFCSHLKCYEIDSAETIHILEYESLCSYYPLHGYYVNNKLLIALKQYVNE